MDFQDVLTILNRFWADKGCVIWQPHNVQVGAGTANPATFLRVLGPEPWKVAYCEPSVRPADGRYGDNPNRWQEYFQYQVILKPSPDNHIDLYLQSLAILGIDWQKNDVRFVEDNWQSPSLGAWGLGWEVWLNGLEITQYTYFQQAGGVDLDPVCVEITYGLERIVMRLQGVKSISEIRWGKDLKYGDLHLADEIDYCRYNFDYAEVDRLRQMYNLNEQEAHLALEHDLVLPAHDYLLKCSHLFNVMDARGSIGVTQRAKYFARMRELAHQIALAFLRQREKLGFPLNHHKAAESFSASIEYQVPRPETSIDPADFLLEIGMEELPPRDLTSAVQQLKVLAPQMLESNRLPYQAINICGTPRRLIVYVIGLAAYQSDIQQSVRGPSVDVAFDKSGLPTAAALGFARAYGISADELTVSEFAGRKIIVLNQLEKGLPTAKVLSSAIPEMIRALKFSLAMRWNETGTVFARPIRWLCALHGAALIELTFAGVQSSHCTRGLRSQGADLIPIAQAQDYFATMSRHEIIVDVDMRRQQIWKRVVEQASSIGALVVEDDDLIAEVTNLVEAPSVIVGNFDPAFLDLPEEVLIAIMRKHQRYFPLRHQSDGRLLNRFIVVANGPSIDRQIVRYGNEEVIRARFSDAAFFFHNDTNRIFDEFVPRLADLTFHQDLGSYLDKTKRIVALAETLGNWLGLSLADRDLVRRAAWLCKADLATDMVVELTSLQGIMGRIYALASREDPRIAEAILEHYQPRFAGDMLPRSPEGLIVGLADRLDSLTGWFAAGFSPRGDTDPYGLRRTALGLIQMLTHEGLSLSVATAITTAAQQLPIPCSDDRLSDCIAFIRKRFYMWLVEQGFRSDLVESVLEMQSDDPARAFQSLKELTLWSQQADFRDLIHAYSRVIRIIQTIQEDLPLHTDNLKEPESRALYDRYVSVTAQLASSADMRDVLAAMATLVPFIESFFENILVMHDDTVLRNARLGLLQHVAKLPKRVMNLGRISAAG